MMFYGFEEGNRLIDEKNYPLSIKNYLKEENRILTDYIKNFDIIIEVGCMVARNIEVAILNKKKYIGIDIIPEYITLANQMVKKFNLSESCELLCINAEKLDYILQKSELIKKCHTPLFFFPFNSFGNINDHISALKSIKKIKGATFIIFSYKTDENTTKERIKYYGNCNYDNLTTIQETLGVRCVADNGLNSMAYKIEYLVNYVKNIDMHIDLQEFSDIGIAFFIKN